MSNSMQSHFIDDEPTPTLKDNAARSGVLPTPGAKFRTKAKLEKDTGGFLVADKNTKTRRPNANCTYEGWVPGAGGDLWWMKHEDGTTAAYIYTELWEVVETPMPKSKAKPKATTKEVEYTIVVRLPGNDLSNAVELEQALEAIRGYGSADVVDIKVVEG